MNKLVEFLRSPEMRTEFPDPTFRRLVAEAALEPRLDPVEQAMCLCGMAKQHIPSVDRAVATLTPRMEDHWTRVMGAAIAEVERLLLELEDEMPTSGVDALALAGQDTAQGRNRTLEALVAASLLIVRRAANAPLEPQLERLVGAFSNNIIRSGGNGLTLERNPLFRSASREDLNVLLAARTHVREAEIGRHIENFLTIRSNRVPEDKSITPAARRPGIETWRKDMRGLVGLPPKVWMRLAVDQWSVRWFVISQFTSLTRTSGASSLFLFNNPPGGPNVRTTPFCATVHGRPVSVSKMQRQIDRHVELVLEQDVDGVLDNWPLLDPAVTQSDDPRTVNRGLASVGLPPFHNRCRTVLSGTAP